MRKNLVTIALACLLTGMTPLPANAGPIKRRLLSICKVFTELGSIAGKTIWLSNEIIWEYCDEIQERDRAKEMAKKEEEIRNASEPESEGPQ